MHACYPLDNTAKLNKEEAFNTSGIQTVFWLSELETKLKELIVQADVVYLNKNMHARSTSIVQTRDDRFRLMIEEKFPEKEIKEVAPIMHEIRYIKSDFEIDLIQNACNITEKGLRRILSFIKPGVMEYEIEAELIHEFLRNRSKGFAYEPIIGSGIDSCVFGVVLTKRARCGESVETRGVL